jgi:hypothetical protein
MSLKDEKGIALITALMFTLLSLGIIMMLLQLITQNTKIAGAQKRYKTSVEASYGAIDLVAKDIMPKLFSTYSSATAPVATFKSSFAAVSLDLTQSQFNCLHEKTKKPTSLWSASACSAANKSDVPKVLPDMTFNLPASTGQTGYIVYTKIIDTRCGGDIALGQACSNSSDNPPGTEGLSVGSGVTSNSGSISPQHLPAYYRIDVQGERVSNPAEKANISVLYAY